MGFFNNLLRRAVSSAADTVTDSVINAVLGKDDQSSGNAASHRAMRSEESMATATSGRVAVENGPGKGKKAGLAVSGEDAIKENKAATRQGNCSGEDLLRRRIEDIATREKPEYELRQRVPSSQVGAPRGRNPILTMDSTKMGYWWQ